MNERLPLSFVFGGQVHVLEQVELEGGLSKFKVREGLRNNTGLYLSGLVVHDCIRLLLCQGTPRYGVAFLFKTTSYSRPESLVAGPGERNRHAPCEEIRGLGSRV